MCLETLIVSAWTQYEKQKNKKTNKDNSDSTVLYVHNDNQLKT